MSGSFMLHDSDRPCLRKPGHVDRKLMSDVSDSMLVFDGGCQRVLQQAAAARDRNLVDATDSESLVDTKIRPAFKRDHRPSANHLQKRWKCGIARL